MGRSNKLIPILAIIALLIVGVVLYKQFAGSQPVRADAPMHAVPALPDTSGADSDTPEETLRTVVTSNEELRAEVAKVLEQNKRLQEQNAKLGERVSAVGSADDAKDSDGETVTETAQADEPAPQSAIERAIDQAARSIDVVTSPDTVRVARQKTADAIAPGEPGADGLFGASAPGSVSYSTMAPMGYVFAEPKGSGNAQAGRYVRAYAPTGAYAPDAAGGPASQAAAAAQRKVQDKPFFTIPENATLAGATGMTALIGRVPIDGRVTDPLQFKAVIGRDNLAANRFELPPDIAGMIISGIAIGDMALSCTEGRVRSATFVFNDGTIRTISKKRGNRGSLNTQGGVNEGDYIGYISDLHGNPCLPGEFVTNAPRYLTDIVGLGALSVAGQAYSDAQRTTYSDASGSSSTVTGSVGHYALGQAVAGGTSEVTQWLMQRLNNSFDAVIIPAGKQMVVHITDELRIDKAAGARRLVHRMQDAAQIAGGHHYGLD